jgi:hypothetical protein
MPSQARSVMIPKMPESTLDAQNIMHMLADGTGGFVIKNTNDLFAGLQKIGLEIDEYYILGYTPPESPEGSCHALKVKVDKGAAGPATCSPATLWRRRWRAGLLVRSPVQSQPRCSCRTSTRTRTSPA